MLCSIIWQVLQLEYSLTCFKSYFNKWKKLSIGIDFGIGIDQNSWYRYRYRYRPKKLVSPITSKHPRSVLPFSKSKFLFFVIKISLNSLDCIRYFLENSLKFH